MSSPHPSDVPSGGSRTPPACDHAHSPELLLGETPPNRDNDSMPTRDRITRLHHLRSGRQRGDDALHVAQPPGGRCPHLRVCFGSSSSEEHKSELQSLMRI